MKEQASREVWGHAPKEISRILTPLSPLSQVSELLTVKQGLDSDKWCSSLKSHGESNAQKLKKKV